MNDSILKTIKTMLGPGSDDPHFDTDIIIHINTALSVLNQLGLGPQGGFLITGSTETWVDFLSDDKTVEMAKTYIYLKVKLIFDPPSNSSLIEVMRSSMSEIEWRVVNR